MLPFFFWWCSANNNQVHQRWLRNLYAPYLLELKYEFKLTIQFEYSINTIL
jgi:hypothetical protein